jgi:hypothetical protein
MLETSECVREREREGGRESLPRACGGRQKARRRRACRSRTRMSLTDTRDACRAKKRPGGRPYRVSRRYRRRCRRRGHSRPVSSLCSAVLAEYSEGRKFPFSHSAPKPCALTHGTAYCMSSMETGYAMVIYRNRVCNGYLSKQGMQWLSI